MSRNCVKSALAHLNPTMLWRETTGDKVEPHDSRRAVPASKAMDVNHPLTGQGLMDEPQGLNSRRWRNRNPVLYGHPSRGGDACHTYLNFARLITNVQDGSDTKLGEVSSMIQLWVRPLS